jgi:hypothetical protein
MATSTVPIPYEMEDGRELTLRRGQRRVDVCASLKCRNEIDI